MIKWNKGLAIYAKGGGKRLDFPETLLNLSIQGKYVKISLVD